MKESVAVAKEADTMSSPTKSDKSSHHARNEPERQLGSLRSVINNIRRDGGSPSVDSIATELSSMHTAQRASVLLALQQTHGNRYVQRVVTGIQAKLKVGQPGDKYEQEADRVADAVMRMPELQVQRQSEEEEEKEEEEILLTKEIQSYIPEVTPELESCIQALKGGGQPLPESVRAFFEPRIGYDFGGVLIHTDADANKLSEELGAVAFTIGKDVFFREAAYEPSSEVGKRLIGHELAHVVQQERGTKAEKESIGQAGDAFEQEAAHVGRVVAQGQEVPIRAAPSVPAIQLEKPEEKRAPTAEGEKSVAEKGEVISQNNDTFFRLYNFEIGSAELKPAFKDALNQIAHIMTGVSPDATVEIHGHASRTGPEELNERLADQRANAVAEYLIAQGVLPIAIVGVRGFGYKKPIADNKTSEGRSKNRRVEIQLNIKAPKPPSPTIKAPTPTIGPATKPKPKAERECMGISCNAFEYTKKHWIPLIKEREVKEAIKREMAFLRVTKYRDEYRRRLPEILLYQPIDSWGPEYQKKSAMLNQKVEIDARRRIFSFIAKYDPSFRRVLPGGDVNKAVSSDYAK